MRPSLLGVVATALVGTAAARAEQPSTPATDRFACSAYDVVVGPTRGDVIPPVDLRRWAYYVLKSEGILDLSRGNGCRVAIDVVAPDDAPAASYHFSAERHLDSGAAVVAEEVTGLAVGTPASRRDQIRAALEAFVTSKVSPAARNGAVESAATR